MEDGISIILVINIVVLVDSMIIVVLSMVLSISVNNAIRWLRVLSALLSLSSLLLAS